MASVKCKKTQSEKFILSLGSKLNDLHYYFCHLGSALAGNP